MCFRPESCLTPRSYLHPFVAVTSCHLPPSHLWQRGRRLWPKGRYVRRKKSQHIIQGTRVFSYSILILNGTPDTEKNGSNISEPITLPTGRSSVRSRKRTERPSFKNCVAVVLLVSGTSLQRSAEFIFSDANFVDRSRKAPMVLIALPVIQARRMMRARGKCAVLSAWSAWLTTTQ